MDTNYIIETKNLTKQYGSQKSVADLNIHVKRGRIYGLLGRNGAGKTTTMKMLLGLTKPTSGEVKIWGKSLQGNEKKLLPRIGSLIESPGFYPNLTGTENLRIFATLRGVPNNHAIKDALDLVGLPYKDKKLFSQYSLGMKQRLAIALAVMHDPELLILDEPINGLDPIGIAEVRSFIRELCDARGKTILISSHILSEIYGIGYKLFLAVETGIFITAGTLPLIVLVVFFSKTYVFSILLCVFYSVLNMSATALFDTLPKTMLWLLPTPLTTFWSAGDMAAHGIKMDLEQMTGLIPSTFQVVFILGIMAFISFLLIDRLYKQRGE